MGRKCSQCGKIGHNLRTCTLKNTANTASFKLFGVQCSYSPSSSSSTSLGQMMGETDDKSYNGYASDELIGHTQHRKKGVAWTEEEHMQFLAGLGNLGKGDWKGISRDFVSSRTATQIASHAQKYFLRQIFVPKGNRRPSLFDMETNRLPIQKLSEHNNFCGLTLDTTNKASLDDDFRSIKLDPFASGYPNFQPDLELTLASNSGSVPLSKRLLQFY